MGSVVVCDKRAGDRRAGGPVVPDAHGHGQQVRPPWCSRSSWPLRVSLTDSIACRIQLIDPWRGAWPRRADTAGVREQLAGDLAFPGLRIGQAPGRRHPVRDVPVACLWLAAFTLWVVL